MANHYQLIDLLSAEAGPVRRISPAWARVAVLAPLMLAIGLVATTMLPHVAGGWSVPRSPIGLVSVALCLLLGFAALVQAFAMSVAGGVARGRGGTIAGLIGWLAVVWATIDWSLPSGASQEGRPFCLAFLLVAGIPMVAIVIIALRRTRSLTPLRSLATAGFGVAFLSLGLLAFCHPVEVSAADLATHVIAAFVLGLLSVAFGRRAVAI